MLNSLAPPWSIRRLAAVTMAVLVNGIVGKLPWFDFFLALLSTATAFRNEPAHEFAR
jgi:hypothetical protein